MGAAPARLLGALVAAAIAIALVGFGPSPADTTVEVTWAADVAPILYEACAGCHRPGGSAPFSLLTLDDARRHAREIARATASGAMPPWLPDSPGQFLAERRLTEAQISILQQWVADGALPGDLAAAPQPPVLPDGWQLGEPDLIVDFPSYAVPAEGRDVFRNLVVRAPVQRTRYVSAVELDPGDPRVVHHTTLTVDTTGSSRVLDGRDGTPGFDGMDGGANVMSPDGHFLGWTPGRAPRPPLEDLAWRLEPGTDLVLQLHLRPTGRPERVAPRVALHFTDTAPKSRPVLMVLESAMIDIPAGEDEYRVTSSYRLPIEVDVLSVYPHAHYLGRELRGSATLPDGSVRELIRIPRWDFDWQDEYRYKEQVRLPAGTQLTLSFTFDNSARNPRNPSDPPRSVVYGLSSTDEMAQLILQLLPRDPAERETLVADAAWHHRGESMTYMAAQEIRSGDESLRLGDPTAAIHHYREALQYRFDHAAALAGLAHALVAAGDHESARIVAERAVQVTNRRDAHALSALADAYAGLGSREAIGTAEEALELARRLGHVELADSLDARLPRYRAIRR